MSKKTKFSKGVFLDFETTTAAISEVETSIYIWGAMHWGDTELNWDITMHSLFDYLLECKTTDAYFHNLTFDGDFMFKYWLDMGWTFLIKDDFEDSRGNKHYDNCWTWLCDESGSIYRMTLRYKGHEIKFHCTYKMLATSVADLGKSLGENKVKGDIDYDAYNVFASKDEVDDDLLKYLKRDIEIVMESVEKFHNIIDVKMTISGTAYQDFIESYGPRTFANDFGGLVWNYKTKKKEYFHILSKNDWQRVAPSYLGGWTGFGVDRQGKTYDGIDGWSYDINSSYPGTMMKFKMPYGRIQEIEPSGSSLKMVVVNIIKATMKPEHKNMPAFIKDKHTGKYQDSKYLRVVENEEYTFWEFEWDDIQHYYDVEFELQDEFWFKSKMIFKDWIDSRKKYKMEAPNKIEKDMWKRVVNGFGGKFGQNIERLSRIIVHDPEREVRSKLRYGKHSEYTHMKHSEEVTDIRHIAVISYTTAKARHNLRNIISINRDITLYFDTDSIYTVKEPELPDELIDDEEFYLWKPEHRFSKFMGIRPKVYMMDVTHEYDKKGKWKEKNKMKLTASGLSRESRPGVNWDNFFDGSIIENGKTYMSSVKGGKIMLRQDFVLSSTQGHNEVIHEDETINTETETISEQFGGLIL